MIPAVVSNSTCGLAATAAVAASATTTAAKSLCNMVMPPGEMKGLLRRCRHRRQHVANELELAGAVLLRSVARRAFS
jgi:hypothetical protein